MNFLTEESWDFTLLNYGPVWEILVQIMLLLTFLLIGNVLRNKVKLFKKFLIPSALIGGLCLLIFDLIIRQFNAGEGMVNSRIMQIVTYHGLGIGFAAMTLKNEKKDKSLDRGQVLDNGLMTAGTYMLQGLCGLGITILMFMATKNSEQVISYIPGLILPLAFGQGPGNALTWDINFTNTSEAMFFGNGSFGLSLASIGFIVASVVGILYINWFKRKGKIVVNEAINNQIVISKECLTNNEIPDNESVDKFSIQVGLVSLVYAISFGFMCLLSFNSFTNSIAWGFNFIWAAGGAVLIKVLFKFFKKKNWMHREYIDNYQMDRISGFAFDLMIVAGVAAIEIGDVQRYILPIIILSIVGTIITYVYIRIIAINSFKDCEHEFFVMSYGTLTGTASNGMILLKEIDPNLKTPVSNLYIVSTFPAMIFTAPLLLILSFASSSFINSCISFGIITILFIIYTLIIFRNKLFRLKKNNK